MSRVRRVLESLHRPRDTVAGWIALTTMVAMVTALALNGLFGLLAGVWARPPLMETGLMERLATITRILDSAAPGQRPGIARAASEPAFTTEWLQHYEDARMPRLDDPEFSVGSEFLRRQLRNPTARIEAYQPSDWPQEADGKGYALLIGLTDGSWVMFSVVTRSWGLDELPRNLIVIALVVLSTIVVALVATRHLASPLERFAQGARRFGTDFRAPPIPVEGPREIRQAILAFNAMQAQLQHFINDRTQMLAAISHDLRAPLTRMRLRGEFIDDAEQQSKLFRDVDEMQAMVNAALEFFRDDARLEPATAFDLAELLHTVIDDFKDSGTEVPFSGPCRFVYLGRPIGIKRMLINLVENAIKYGHAPSVQMKTGPDRVEIRVLDRGPGIAPEHHEAVFKPFFRLEGSRNKNTGGVGLGLSAARATVLEHGGALTLRNRKQGGLEVRVVLPFG
ncbi:ATP-binding protein [Pseudomonas sp. RIT-PI-AD]|uniref:ATP-binding protein n=1 Tax=Pseudomonas sp. RIT-PI-AD TaxID=3035294 RepID=UPI0021D8565C|nr:ATP-binding protein [Pseudomonas sp. RIT-PI-AD]